MTTVKSNEGGKRHDRDKVRGKEAQVWGDTVSEMITVREGRLS